MADTDKNILITPNVGSTDEPTIVFTGSDNNPVTLRVLDDGTISFEGSSGQLFSVADNLSGTIFSVNDVSGIPSIEVDDSGLISLAEFGGNVLIGKDIDSTNYKLQVAGEGAIQVTGTNPYIRFSENEVDKAFIQWNSSGYLMIGNDEDLSRIRLRDDVEFSPDNSNWYNIWHAGNDGSGSGLDADTLDGSHASAFATSGHNHDATYAPISHTHSYLANVVEDTSPELGGNLDLKGFDIVDSGSGSTSIANTNYNFTVIGGSTGTETQIIGGERFGGVAGATHVLGYGASIRGGDYYYGTTKTRSGGRLSFSNNSGGYHLTLLQGADVEANVTDLAGGDVTIIGGRSSGTEAGGSIIFKTYDGTGNTSGTTLGTSTTALTIDQTGTARFGASIYPSSDNTGQIGNGTYTWNFGHFTNFQVDSTLTVRSYIDLADSDGIRFGSSDDSRFWYNGSTNNFQVEMEASCLGHRWTDNGTEIMYLEKATGDLTVSGAVTTKGIDTRAYAMVMANFFG